MVLNNEQGFEFVWSKFRGFALKSAQWLDKVFTDGLHEQKARLSKKGKFSNMVNRKRSNLEIFKN
jgi:hypothetical protein